ncbi:MAG: proton-conducting transporter membrane subunit [Verrucomicrobia bacterium]|nr:proton-conducting transporter membrane subunit [Verrucomicrobiota bacterium]
MYGLMRYFLWLVPAEAQGSYPVGTWGLVMAGLGTVTLFTGTMQALKQEQTKRLLAFHSIGQAGYILLGLGTCLALLPASDWGVIALATTAFFGALFHTLNHALFKSLLFLNAGALLAATHTQDLNRLGGLLRWMPVTAVATLMASFSIAGVPLFNGFVSKWCIFSAAVQGGPWAAALPVLALIGILTSALTLASFIKFFGASFLGRTSTHVAACAAGRDTLEVGWMMRVPQMLLAGACLTLGLLPFLAVRLYEAGIEARPAGAGGVAGTGGRRRGRLVGGGRSGRQPDAVRTAGAGLDVGPGVWRGPGFEPARRRGPTGDGAVALRVRAGGGGKPVRRAPFLRRVETSFPLAGRRTAHAERERKGLVKA